MIVLLHGFASTPAAWSDVAAQVGGAMMPPALGHGAGYVAGSFDDEVDRLATLIEVQMRGPVVLGGYSMGGRIALGIVVRHPSLVRRAVLIGAHPGLPEAERARRIEQDEARAEDLEAHGMSSFFERWDVLPMFSRRPPPRREGLDAQDLARSLRVLGLGRMPPRWNALAEVRVPITWVAGEHDAKHVELARLAAATNTNFARVIVPGSDHDVLGCAPGAVADMLREAA